MSIEQLGEPLTGAYSTPGGQARLYERGMTVASPVGGEVIVSFAFPMIGRPSIVTGNAARTLPFDASAITFRLGSGPLKQVGPLIRKALAGRLRLAPTGQGIMQVPLTIGPVRIVKPAHKLLGGIKVSALYGVAVSAGALRQRQLYDVEVLADGDEWCVVAPHAVYHRETWTDFGIAHITDMHVARRIDRFRGILVQAGRSAAAQRVYNWNDRFRGFVRYANYMHSLGVLDVILATGDLFDYLYEDDDDKTGGGNALFLRKLILGQAPGPEFPDVEELRVPIFMVPGNHDYRKHPYKLFFDVQISLAGVPKDVTRVKNFDGYHLLQDDAQLLTNGLDGRAGSKVQNLSPSRAARMLEVDPEIKAYKAFLADRGSYIVRLGAHGIAMVDSSHDVGTVTEALQALLVKVGLGSEDEATFVGGSPNCEGVSADELKMVSDAMAHTPADGLFIVGLHAPLFNMWNSEYPYFLRETQRAAQPGQAHAFLARHDRLPVLANATIEEQVEARHPHWFGGPHDHRVPTFVTRIDSQDLLEFGVSRGHAEALMSLLAGAGAHRAADVVLAGHTHRHNEFIVRRLATGELAYYMDFYTQNPAHYYPTRFTQTWRGVLGSSPANQAPTTVPVTDVTYVEVVAGAAPDATPWPMPVAAKFKYQLQVPPYPNPLSSAADPRAWWAQHRPLVLQTGALGPLDSAQVSFTGFRVLSVKNDVIDNIHFVSTEKLEAHQYRLPWDEAIRCDSPRRYLHVERSRLLGAPAAVGAPSGIVFAAIGVSNVVYRDAEGRLHELWRKGEATGTSNLTQLADNAILAAADPSSYIATQEGLEMALYRGKDGHVHSLYWSTGAVGRDALSGPVGAPQAAGNPAGFVAKDGTNHVIYRAGDGHLHALWWTGTSPPGHEDLTRPSGAIAAAGDPAPYLNTISGENIVAYRGTDAHIHTLYWSTGAVGHEDLSGFAHAPLAVGDPAAYYTSHNDTHQLAYRSQDGHLHELWWTGSNPVSHWDLSAAAVGAPPAASDPVAYHSPGTNTKHVIYRSADDHLNELCWAPGGGMPAHLDLTAQALAPPATGKPTAFNLAGSNSQHVVYRGADGHIHEIRWTDTVDQHVARINSCWRPDQYINIENGTPQSGEVQPGWLSARWRFEAVVGANHHRIGNAWKPDQYLNIERGHLESGVVEPGMLSAQWLLEVIQGTAFVRLRNRWKPDQCLNIEHGQLEAGPVESGWLSAQWKVENA